MSRLFGLFLLALAVAASGCGTVINGTQARMKIESVPPGAKVWVDGTYRGESPVEVTVSRSELHTVKFEKDGHKELLVQTDREVSAGYVILNVLFTGLVGLAVDAATGGWYEPGPGPLRVVLSPSGQDCTTGSCAYLDKNEAEDKPTAPSQEKQAPSPPDQSPEQPETGERKAQR